MGIFGNRKRKNNLNSLNQEYIDANNRVTEAIEQRDAIKNEMVNDILDIYREEQDRNMLINEAKRFHFSAEKINRIEEIFDNKNFNQDNISYNNIADIIEVRIFIDERKDKPGFLSLVGNFIPERESGNK